MNENKTLEMKKIEFEQALNLRNFEISNFWSRGWFFGALILATISGYFTNAVLEKQVLPSVCISFLILLFSLLQTLMNRGSKYWQERWEYATKNRETILGINLTKATSYDSSEKYYLDRCILSKGENSFVRGQRFSVSKLTFLIWDIICISSFLVWLNDVCNSIDIKGMNNEMTAKIGIFHTVIIAYLGLFCYKGHVYENIKNSTKGTSENHRENKYKKECDEYTEDKIPSAEAKT